MKHVCQFGDRHLVADGDGELHEQLAALRADDAAAGAIFTGLNSLTALITHLQRHIPDLTVMAPLLVAVLIGGVVGSQLGAAMFSAKTVRRTLGLVVLVAIVLLIREVLTAPWSALRSPAGDVQFAGASPNSSVVQGR